MFKIGIHWTNKRLKQTQLFEAGLLFINCIWYSNKNHYCSIKPKGCPAFPQLNTLGLVSSVILSESDCTNRRKVYRSDLRITGAEPSNLLINDNLNCWQFLSVYSVLPSTVLMHYYNKHYFIESSIHQSWWEWHHPFHWSWKTEAQGLGETWPTSQWHLVVERVLA